MSNEELQSLAEELSRLGRERDYERVMTIRSRIAEYEYSLLKRIYIQVRETRETHKTHKVCKAYFPLLRRFNGIVDFELFYDMFTSVLFGLLENYDPAKGATFATALANILDFRLRDVFTNEKKRYNTVNFSALSGDDDEFDILDILDTIAHTDSTEDAEGMECVEEREAAAYAFMRVVPLIRERKKQEEYLPKKDKNYFGTFFTFDIIRAAKEDEDTASACLLKDAELFPVMEIPLLRHLMRGEFEHMRDVVDNQLRKNDSLRNYKITLATYLELSGPTVVERHKNYINFFNAICAE
jgi:hypothetical protein